MSSQFEFNFDDWAALARRDPEAFNLRRDQVVNEACERLGDRSATAISGICWRIDVERQRCSTPMQLCLKLTSLMWDRFYDLNDELNYWVREVKPDNPPTVLKERRTHLRSV